MLIRKVCDSLHHLLEPQIEMCHQCDGRCGGLNFRALGYLMAEGSVLWCIPTKALLYRDYFHETEQW